jgi:hypothetical protein
MPGDLPRSDRRAMKIIIRVLLIGGVLLGAFLFRDRISGNAGDLQVGDCFDVPAGDNPFYKVQHHPCSEPHTGEVVFVIDHPAAKGTPFTRSMLLEFASTSCIPALDAYIGITAGDRIDVGALYPDSKEWDDGDRKITCYASMVDGSSLSTSFKAS